MGFSETLLTSVIIIIVVPIVLSVFWLCKTRAEKKLTTDGSIKTRPSKLLTGFFLGFGIIVLCGGIFGIVYCSITDKEHTSAATIIILAVCVALFSGLGFFGYAYARFNSVIADNDGVHVYRLFRKKRYYRYEEIGSFKDSTAIGALGGLTGYDKNGKKIFTADAMLIGASAVAQRLRDRGVTERK